jgi:hypothetical protein
MATGPPNPDKRDQTKQGFWKSIQMDWHSELCAEHDGSIACFESLTTVLTEIEDYETLFLKKRRNLMRTGKIAAGVAAGAVVVCPAAIIAAPHVAAALGAAGVLGAAGTGTAISTLSGAALGSASLAAIGGGTMAGGMILLTATGTALGGAIGGVVSNSYFGQVRGFSIRKLNEGHGPSIVFVNGFLTQKVDDPRDWKKALRASYPAFPWYHVNWEAKTRYAIGSTIMRDSTGRAARQFAIKLASRAAKKAGNRMNPIIWVATLAELFGNPWHVAMIKAAMSGILLADILARTPDQQFVLMGHSLGARVIYYALLALSTKKRKRLVRSVYLLGGAVGAKTTGPNSEDSWRIAARAVSGKIYNCYSRNDQILKLLYRGASGMMSLPIGAYPIASKSRKVRNLDFSEVVNRHNEWKQVLPEILSRIEAS